MTAPHHVILGRGEPKVLHSSLAVFPSVTLYNNESSVRICGGRTTTATHTGFITHITKAAAGLMWSFHHKNGSALTDDKDVGVGEDGAVFVGGLALVHRSVPKLHISHDENSSCHCTPGVWVYIYKKCRILEQFLFILTRAGSVDI